MPVRLFVGNLAYDVTEEELRELMSPVGTPLSVRILTDRETGKPRGFAFVEFSDSAQAEEAVRRFNQQVFKNRPLVVNEARPREEGFRPRPGPSAAPSWSGVPSAPDRPARPGQPTRTFGPDAPPRGKRRTKGRSPKGERPPKGPLRERTTGQFFAGGVDDVQDDDGADDVAFWAREAQDESDEK
jgi:RNA recognition motif-containing protein